MSQQEQTPQPPLPACLAQGESDVGQIEDSVLSMLSPEQPGADTARVTQTHEKVIDL